MRNPISLLCVFVVLFCVFPLFANWSDPVLLYELNDPESPAVATRPTISSDENVIYFVRHLPTQTFFLWEAKRDTVTGLFTTERIVSELGMEPGRPIYSTWLSEDSLRFYVSKTRYIPSSTRWENHIYLAVRHHVEAPWTLSRSAPVIRYGESDGSHSLTSDELLILWESRPDVDSPFSTYEATRQSTALPFGNFREVSELNELGAQNPRMTSDGLVVFFSKEGQNGFYNLWKGFRKDLSEPFGSFELLADISSPEANDMAPSITPDGKSIYFFRGAPGFTEKGIYVSHWIECPYETAMDNLRQAAELKRQAEEMVSESIDLELEALRLLSELKPKDLPQGIVIRDVRRARIALLRAVQRQVIARMNLTKGIELLGEALFGLTPPPQDEYIPEEPPARPVIGIRQAEARPELIRSTSR